MADRRTDKGKAKAEDDEVPLKAEDDEVPLKTYAERKMPRPEEIVHSLNNDWLTPEKCDHIHRTLTSAEVDEESPILYFDAEKATFFTKDPEIPEILQMYDVNNRPYYMSLSPEASGGTIRYSLSHDWMRFVWNNNLKAGDEIHIFKVSDANNPRATYFSLFTQ